jgi:hypothetical protein
VSNEKTEDSKGLIPVTGVVMLDNREVLKYNFDNEGKNNNVDGNV